MPGAHIPSRMFAGGPAQQPSGPPEPIGPGDVVRLVAFWVVLVGGSVAGAVTHNAYLLVGPWFLFAVLVVVAFRFDGARPDPVDEARATADGVVADLRARAGHGPAAQGVRPEPDAPRAPAAPPASTAAGPEPAVPEPTVPEPAAAERAVVPGEAAGGGADSPADSPADPPADSLADLGALVAVCVEERISSLLAVMERRGTRAQWRFFLLGVPVGFLVNWASARLWG